MIELAGLWSDGKTSRQVPALLRVFRSGEYQLELDNETSRGALREVDFSPRLGSTPRLLTFADGAVLETPDNDLVDALLAEHRRSGLFSLVHLIESHWGAVLGLTLGTVMFAVIFFVYGVPALAKAFAFSMPYEWLDFLPSYTVEGSGDDAKLVRNVGFYWAWPATTVVTFLFGYFWPERKDRLG